MSKYLGKNDFDKGTEFKVIRDIITSYGTLFSGQKVTLLEVTHFPTSYRVIDKDGKIVFLTRLFEEKEFKEMVVVIEKLLSKF